MIRRMKSLLLVALLAASALAAPAKKYHFDVVAVTPKPEVKADVAKIAKERVEQQFKKALDSNPQLVSNLEGAPDWQTKADAYRRYLTQKGISGSYLVNVEITEASEA